MIKSNDGDNKAVQKKKAIMSKITTQVHEVKDSKVGHLIVKFADKEKLENARKEFEENIDDINISVVEKEKIKPKIKVCNVDADVDDVIEDIKERNKWINDYIQEEDDFILVKELNTRKENNRHYIIKCTPEIRKQIFIRGEILYTLYKKNKVFDSYNVYQCFKCQGFVDVLFGYWLAFLVFLFPPSLLFFMWFRFHFSALSCLPSCVFSVRV